MSWLTSISSLREDLQADRVEGDGDQHAPSRPARSATAAAPRRSKASSRCAHWESSCTHLRPGQVAQFLAQARSAAGSFAAHGVDERVGQRIAPSVAAISRVRRPAAARRAPGPRARQVPPHSGCSPAASPLGRVGDAASMSHEDTLSVRIARGVPRRAPLRASDDHAPSGSASAMPIATALSSVAPASPASAAYVAEGSGCMAQPALMRNRQRAVPRRFAWAVWRSPATAVIGDRARSSTSAASCVAISTVTPTWLKRGRAP